MKRKFSQPIRADKDAYYMSVPEVAAKHVALQLQSYQSAVELCSAVGMMCVQIAKYIPKVVGIENDPIRVRDATYNAELYRVSEKIEFVCGDVLDESLLRSIKADIAILDPDWSAAGNDKIIHTSFDRMQPNLFKMIDLAKKHITQDLVVRLPKETNMGEIEMLKGCRLENIYIDNNLKFRIAYLSGGVGQKEADVFLNSLT
jgi:tRNA1(Val) A37 N6-methylase TrmN6